MGYHLRNSDYANSGFLAFYPLITRTRTNIHSTFNMSEHWSAYRGVEVRFVQPQQELCGYKWSIDWLIDYWIAGCFEQIEKNERNKSCALTVIDRCVAFLSNTQHQQLSDFSYCWTLYRFLTVNILRKKKRCARNIKDNLYRCAIDGGVLLVSDLWS